MSKYLKPEWEKSLKEGMAKLGEGVEWVIEKSSEMIELVREALPSHGATVKPILALEGQIPLRKLKDLIVMSADKLISESKISLVDKSVIEIGEDVGRFSTMLKERGAGMVIEAEIGPISALQKEHHPIGGIHTIQTSLKGLPFENGYFDFALGNLATHFQGNLAHAIQEISRILTLGGNGIVIDFHPHGRYARQGKSRLKGLDSSLKGVGDYYLICRSADLTIVDVKEIFVDESLRDIFTTTEERAVFRSIKDTPLLIGVYVKKN